MITSDAATIPDRVAATSADADNDIATDETEHIESADPIATRSPADDDASDDAQADLVTAAGRWSIRRRRAATVTAFCVLPLSAMAFGVAAAYFKWDAGRSHDTYAAGLQAVEAARDNTLAMLSYQPDTAADTLTAAASRLAGPFRDQYTKLVTDVVIPGATQRKVAALVNIPAAATVSASPDHAVVLVFVNQDVTVGNEPPRDTSSTVKVTLDKVGDRWLTTSFDPM